MKKYSMVAAIAIGLVTFSMAILLSLPLKGLAPESPYLISQVGLKLILIILSVAGAKVFSVPISTFTENANGRKIRKYILLSLLLGALGSIFVLVSGIPRMPGISSLSFFQVILVIWLWSSVSEEIFARGFVYGLLKNKLQTYSISTVTFTSGAMASAIVFSLIHLSIYLGGGAISTTLTIMTLTFFLGLLCGKTRDEVNLLSAIYVHIAFNVGGAIGGIIANLISFILTGERIV